MAKQRTSVPFPDGNLIVADTYAATLARLKRLQVGSQPRWGKMTPVQMLSHQNKYLQMALGELPARRLGFGLTERIAKSLFLGQMAYPKQLPTLAALKPDPLDNTPENLHRLLLTQLELLARLRENCLDNRPFPTHPVFGPVDAPTMGRLIWKHFDHHLLQFGL